MTNTTKVRRLPMPTNARELSKRLKALGCEPYAVKGGHLRVDHPKCGAFIQVAKTPSDPANIGNMVTRLRRIGIDLRTGEVWVVADPRG